MEPMHALQIYRFLGFSKSIKFERVGLALDFKGYSLFRTCLYDPTQPGLNEALNDFEVLK